MNGGASMTEQGSLSVCSASQQQERGGGGAAAAAAMPDGDYNVGEELRDLTSRLDFLKNIYTTSAANNSDQVTINNFILQTFFLNYLLLGPVFEFNM